MEAAAAGGGGGGGGAPKPAGRAKPEAGGAKAGGSIIAAEDRERGVVAMSLWVRYAEALGWISMSSLIGIYSLSQVFTYGSSWWLTQWAADTFPSVSHGEPWFYMAVYSGAPLVAAPPHSGWLASPQQLSLHSIGASPRPPDGRASEPSRNLLGSFP